jgi:hypothetical protein
VLEWALMPALVLVLMLVLAMMQTMTVCHESSTGKEFQR